jgi:SNF2-related domain
LFIDEAHCVKGGSATASGQALIWLQSDYTVLVTATPIINSPRDLKGLEVLEKGDLWADDNLQKLGVKGF